jgi:hypothetical protein
MVKRQIASAQKLHDVCAGCNNGPLSDLDSYICKLNDKYFRTIINPGVSITFKYDFDLLLRGLLKIGFNVARTRKWSLVSLESARSYILGRSRRPPGYRIFLQLLIPSAASKTDLPVSSGTTKIPPIPLHAALENVSSISGLESARSLCFWSYRFSMLHEDVAKGRSVRRRAKKIWLNNLRGAIELDRRGYDFIYASPTTVLEIYESNPQFRHQVARARDLKSSIDEKKAKLKTP